ncbi:MAG: anhydro-N-acetylmuramic acid kinase [Pseudomonadota bacterium]
MSKFLRAIGVMSGTSLDGVDLALIETDGDEQLKRRDIVASYPYEAAFRADLRECLKLARSLTRRDERPRFIASVERQLTDLHAEALRRFMGSLTLQPFSVDVIGYHGQTIFHDPARYLTVQIGDGARLARELGVDVVHDMRAADIAAGGQGAPLAPAYHRALANPFEERPIAFLNIGGVSNITYIGRLETMMAFDTGPGNALIDDWVARHTGDAYDHDGGLAARGQVNERALQRLLDHPFFDVIPPKSLDRNHFSVAPVEGLSPADGAATLTAFTAQAVARGCENFLDPPELIVVTGGGRANATLLRFIRNAARCPIAPAEAFGLNGDTIEAEAWAYLAVRALNAKPLTYPMTTGVPEPLTGGVVSRAGAG